MSWGTILGSATALVAKDPAVLGKAAKYALKGAIMIPAAGYVGWKVFGKGEGLDDVVVGVAAGDDAKKNYKEKGVVGVVKLKAMGPEATNKSLGEGVIDEVAGEGTFKNTKDVVGNTIDKTQEVAGKVIEGTGEALAAVGEGARQVYNGVTDRIQGSTPEPSYANNGGQDLTPEQIYQIYQQQALTQQQNQVGNLYAALSPFASLGNLLGGLTSGTGLSLSAMIPAAFMMFGNFGWMGKIASLFLGALAYKNMKQPAPVAYQPSLQQVVQSRTLPYTPEAASLPQESENVVHRSRGI